jgi:cytochrome P450
MGAPCGHCRQCLLMAARDEETGQQMDDKLLRDEVATLMLAGHETTANAFGGSTVIGDDRPKI